MRLIMRLMERKMKKILIAVLIASTLLYSCKAKDAAAAADAKDATKTEAADAAAPAAEKPAKPATKADIAYAFGVAIGTSIKETGVEIDYSAFVKGMKDTMESKKAKVTVEEAGSLIQGALMEAQAKKAVAAAAEEAKFFEENGKKAGVTTTASGLQFEVMKPSDGAKPVAANTVKVDYVGTLLNGTTFDSSITRGEPAVFPLEGVIPGWTEGVQLMTVGSKYKFWIPSALAYGDQGAGDVIPANSILVFEVDLLSIEK